MVNEQFNLAELGQFNSARYTLDQVKKIKSKRQSGILIKYLMAEYKLSKKSIYNYLELAKEGVMV